MRAFCPPRETTFASPARERMMGGSGGRFMLSTLNRHGRPKQGGKAGTRLPDTSGHIIQLLIDAGTAWAGSPCDTATWGAGLGRHENKMAGRAAVPVRDPALR